MKGGLQLGRLLSVHHSGDWDTEVGDWPPEVYNSKSVDVLHIIASLSSLVLNCALTPCSWIRHRVPNSSGRRSSTSQHRDRIELTSRAHIVQVWVGSDLRIEGLNYGRHIVTVEYKVVIVLFYTFGGVDVELGMRTGWIRLVLTWAGRVTSNYGRVTGHAPTKQE